MIKKFLSMVAIAGMVFTTSCSSDEFEPTQNGGEAVVSFTTELPSSLQSRAFGDGSIAKNLSYFVYDENWTYLTALSAEDGEKMNGLTATVNLQLVNGETYNVVFWADAENAPYTFDADSAKVAMNYVNAAANAENRDAFYKVESFKVEGNMTRKVELTRPFAQINIGTNDWADVEKNENVSIENTGITVKTYPTLNFKNGKAEGNATDVTFTPAEMPEGETFPVGTVNEYKYLSMNYILATTEKQIVDVTISYNNAIQDRTFTSVPVQRNYRTNIYGKLITSDEKFNVEINPDFEESDNNTFTGGGNLDEALQDSTITFINLTEDATVTTGGTHGFILPDKDLTINGNGHTITFTGDGVTDFGPEIGKLTLNNVTIVDKSICYNEVAWEFAYLEMANIAATDVEFADPVMFVGNCSFKNCTFTGKTTEVTQYGAWVSDGSASFEDCTFKGTRGLKAHEDYGTEISTITVDRCLFDNLTQKPGVALGTLNSETTVAIRNSTFVNCQPGDQGMYFYESDTDVNSFTFINENNTISTKVAEGVTMTNGEYDVYKPEGLVYVFANIKAGDVINITTDLDMTGKTIDATNGNVGITINGNGNTISNLHGTEGGLFVNNTGSKPNRFYNVKLNNCSVNSTSNYGGLFVGDADTCDELVFEGCEVTNCTVKSGKYAAAFVAYTAGYNVQNNGPVYSDITIKDCVVEGGSITGGGSVGAAIGHAGGNPDTTNAITNLTVSNITLTGEDAAHTGVVVGTAHVGETIINGATYSNVDGNYNTEHPLYGRFVPNGTGTLTIDGVEF